MASLTDTTVSGDLTVNGWAYKSGPDLTPWKQMSHCPAATLSSQGRLHIRTPLPADNAAMGWNPIILEVVGYHSYSGEFVEDFKALLNTNGYDNSWYGSQIAVNDSLANSQPYIYRSTNTYGSYKRVCFSVSQLYCCCTGNIWIRWWNGSTWFEDYAWASTSAYDSQSSPVPQF